MRASFTGISEYSDKRLVAFQVTPELGKGADSKVLGASLLLLPQPPVSTVQDYCFRL